MANSTTIQEEGVQGLSTQLLSAVSLGDEGQLRQLIAAGADVNSTEPGALSLAAQHEDPACLQLLIEAGADVNSADASPVWHAMRAHRHTHMSMLVKAGACVNTYSSAESQCPLLIEAVRLHCETCVVILIQAGADVNCRWIHQRCECVLCTREIYISAVYQAAREGSRAHNIVRELVKAGADPNLPDFKEHSKMCTTTLKECIAYGADDSILELLIAAGANVNKPGNIGWSPLVQQGTTRRWRCLSKQEPM